MKNNVKREAHQQLVCGVFVTASLFFCFAVPALASVDGQRKAAARTLAKEIEHAQLRRVYVLDFLDAAGTRTDKGCYFASTFSTNLEKDAHNFAVVNRIQAQKRLSGLHISPQGLRNPETLSKAAATLGADAVLVGTVDISSKNANLFISLRDAASGKEIHSLGYHEHLEADFLSYFPAPENGDAHAYFFPRLDGVSSPKCTYCPDPPYTNEARRNKFDERLTLSLIVDEKGIIRDVRVVQDPGYGLVQRAIDAVKEWRMDPSRDPEGNPVAVRGEIEISFRMI